MWYRPKIPDGSCNCILVIITELFSEGAEAKIYKFDVLGCSLLLKRRESKKYRIGQLDDKIRRSRTKREARIMSIANGAGIRSPRLIAVGRFTICMEFLRGRLLNDVKYGKKEASLAGELLALMHKHDIAHGDFTTANLISDKKDIYVIDFGLSEVTKSIEDKAMDLLLMKRSINQRHFGDFVSSYKSYKDSKLTLSKLDDIEKRGRYKIRTLISV